MVQQMAFGYQLVFLGVEARSDPRFLERTLLDPTNSLWYRYSLHLSTFSLNHVDTSSWPTIRPTEGKPYFDRIRFFCETMAPLCDFIRYHQ